MQDSNKIKEIVKEKYSAIAVQGPEDCGCGCCGEESYSIFSDDYSKLAGYNKEADLGLGCGIPVEFAGIKKGDTVVDLGSGAGNDLFVARAVAGETGTLIGIDFSEEMILKGRKNAEKTGVKNVEFIYSEIENIQLPGNIADVVLSNCVLNLVPDKRKAFSEIHRILKKGAHFCISDVVTKGDLPSKIKESMELYAGCVSGAIQKEEYLEIIKESGFSDITVQKSKTIEVPENELLKVINRDEIREIQEKGMGIFSITVTGKKD